MPEIHVTIWRHCRPSVRKKDRFELSLFMCLLTYSHYPLISPLQHSFYIFSMVALNFFPHVKQNLLLTHIWENNLRKYITRTKRNKYRSMLSSLSWKLIFSFPVFALNVFWFMSTVVVSPTKANFLFTHAQIKTDFTVIQLYHLTKFM